MLFLFLLSTNSFLQILSVRCVRKPYFLSDLIVWEIGVWNAIRIFTTSCIKVFTSTRPQHPSDRLNSALYHRKTSFSHTGLSILISTFMDVISVHAVLPYSVIGSIVGLEPLWTTIGYFVVVRKSQRPSLLDFWIFAHIEILGAAYQRSATSSALQIILYALVFH